MSFKISSLLKITLSICFSFILFFSFFINTVFALYRTESLPVTTTVGNPPLAINDIAGAAIKLVNTVQENCKNSIISINSLSCIQDKLSFFRYQEKAYAELDRSARNVPNHFLQCVGFVQAVIAGVLGERLDKGGNGKDFAWNIPTGYDFIKPDGTVLPGDLPVFPATTSNEYGHISVVTKVLGKDSFETANADGFSGKVYFQLVKRGGYWPLGWLRKKGIKVPDNDILPPPGNIQPPPPGGTEAIRQGIKDTFGISMVGGFSEDQLISTWELFSQSLNTKFPSLVKGAVVKYSIPSDGKYSLAVGCFNGEVTIQMYPFTPSVFFKFILAHELGHRIKSCLPRSISYYQEQEKAYAVEKNFSYYGNCSGKVNEDYAEMIAYYLNPKAGLSSSICGGPKNPPNPFFIEQNGSFIYNEKYPLHYDVAKNILNK